MLSLMIYFVSRISSFVSRSTGERFTKNASRTMSLQFRQDIAFRFRHVFHKIDFGPGESTDLLMPDLNLTEKIHKGILVFHLPGLAIHMGPERRNHVGRIGMPDFEEPHAFSRIVIV